MDTLMWTSLLIALALAVVHLCAGLLRFIRYTPRSRWLSFGAGVTVAYVFLHLFPEMRQGQRHLEQMEWMPAFVQHHVYLIALAGLLVFYSLERFVQLRRGEGPTGEARQTPESDGIFWIHIVAFTIYNALIGYLVSRPEDRGLAGVLLLAGALALHFVVNDFGLREHHKQLYDRVGRWILAAAIPAGWVIAQFYAASEAVLGLAIGFLAGAIVLNVFKEELPEEQESKLLPFLGGAACYAALVLLI